MKSPVILRVFKGNQLVEVKQFDLDQIVIGRKADVGLDLDAEEVSTIHCMIELRDGGYYICDLGSATGTFINGNSTLDSPLSSGDDIGVGPFRISFFVGVPKPKATPPGQISEDTTPNAAPPAAAPVMAAVAAVSIPATMPNIVNPGIPSATPASVQQKAEPKVEPKAEPKFVPIPEVKHEEPKIDAKPKIATVAVTPAGRVDVSRGPAKATVYSKNKSPKTFAPVSEVRDLRDHIRPGKGNVVEVLVSWKERVLTTYHYKTPGIVRLGPGEKYDINMPEGICPTGWPLVEVGPETRIAVTNEMKVELLTENGRKNVEDLLRSGKAQRSGNSLTIKMDQNELYFISLPYSDLQLYVRFVPQPPIVPIAPVLLSSSELTGLVMSFILVALLALYISATSPTMQEDEKKEEIVAQVVFNKPKPTPVPQEKIVQEKPEATPTPAPPKPTPTPKQVKLADTQKEAVSKGKTTNVAAKSANSKAGQASEVAPKPDSKDKPKKFTSTVKKGGAIKQGETAGANAQSKDVSKMGLFSALGSGGMRKNLDKAYQGQGDILGMAGKATGAAGFNEDRAGDDIGGKFKDVGAGGKGTATQGIAGIGTKGRGTGYGTGDGLGDKNSVAIEPGGAEEDFVGTIDREAVRRVIRAGLREIRGCYERELNKLNKTQKLEGKVVIRWKIIEHGKAVGASVASSTLGNRAVENCVRDRLATWRFPEPPTGTEADVNYPFYFRADN
ncbi:MAG: AgmX/PglI C-terminal domain-containing protein [Bdellovibrionaceae bacterium]|nr:AgmX/PglI C-terminal domain-containing protein [Pseudobdellovibrionaceae bacterium]